VTRKRPAHLVLWPVAVVVAVAMLHAAGRGTLAPPPLTSPWRWEMWLEQRDPVVAAFAVLRVVALAFGWYAVAVTLAGLVARAASGQRVVAVLDRLTLPPLRRLLAATVTVTLSAGLANPAVAADRHDPPAPAETTTPTTAAPTITMRRLPPATDPAPLPAADRTWTVQPGQCFWSIAEAVLAESLGRAPSASEVVPYWKRLIDANRASLADRDNPDLVFPRQVFTVPPP
jgi:nucleoid-associated protein YgaU